MGRRDHTGGPQSAMRVKVGFCLAALVLLPACGGPTETDVATGVFEALRGQDQALFVQTMSRWAKHAGKTEGEHASLFRRILERGSRLGIDWGQVELEKVSSVPPRVLMTIKAGDKRYNIHLCSAAERPGTAPPWPAAVGPAPHYHDLRLAAAVSGGPGGGRIAWLHPEMEYQLHFVLKADGLELWNTKTLQRSLLTLDGAEWPRMSPGGKRVIYVGRTSGPRTFHLVDMDGNRFDLGVKAPDEADEAFSGAWSDDGHLYMLTTATREMGILDVEAWTLKHYRVRRGEATLWVSGRVYPKRWLPGQRRIYIPTKVYGNILEGGGGDRLPATVIDCDTDKVYRLTTAITEDVISADGEWIAASRTDRSTQLTSVLAVGTRDGNVLQLATVPTTDYREPVVLLGFSPGGSHLVYKRKAPPIGHYVVALDGTRHFRLSGVGHIGTWEWRKLAWAADASYLFYREVGYAVHEARESLKAPAIHEGGYPRYPLASPNGWLFQVGYAVPAERTLSIEREPKTMAFAFEPRPGGLVVRYKNGKVDELFEIVHRAPPNQQSVGAEPPAQLPSELREHPGWQAVVKKVTPKRLPNQKQTGEIQG